MNSAWWFPQGTLISHSIPKAPVPDEQGGDYDSPVLQVMNLRLRLSDVPKTM